MTKKKKKFITWLSSSSFFKNLWMQVKVGVMEIYKYSVLHGDVELTNMTVTTVFCLFIFFLIFFVS